jgi:hypothetical protein
MAVMETKVNKDVVMTINDARGLRDDISLLLSDLYELQSKYNNEQDNSVIDIEIKGRSF